MNAMNAGAVGVFRELALPTTSTQGAMACHVAMGRYELRALAKVVPMASNPMTTKTGASPSPNPPMKRRNSRTKQS